MITIYIYICIHFLPHIILDIVPYHSRENELRQGPRASPWKECSSFVCTVN